MTTDATKATTYERRDHQTRELVDTILERVQQLARHPANEGSPDELRALLSAFASIAEAELEQLELELEPTR